MADAARGAGPLPVPVEAAEEGARPGELRLTMFVVLAGAVMPILDAEVILLALRSVAAGLGMPLTTAQWTLNGYLLAFTAAVPTSTWAAARFGPERVYLAGLGLFTGASALCGVAESWWELIPCRAVQGAGAGLIGSVGRMMLVAAAGPRRLPRAMAAYGIPIMLVSVGCPLLGGGLLACEGWRAVFFINVPIGLLAMVPACRLLPPRAAGPKPSLDTVGLLLASPGLVCVTYGLSRVGRNGALDVPRVVVPLCVGAVLLALFAGWSLRRREPLLDLRLYRNVVFRAAAQSTLVTGGLTLGGSFLLPWYLQSVRGEDTWRTGLLAAPQHLGAVAAMWLSGRLTEKAGMLTALAGSCVLLVATVPLAFLSPTTPYEWLITDTVVRGIGIGLVATPVLTAAFRALPARVGEASTQFNVLYHIGGSLGTSVLVFVLDRLSHPAPRGPLPGSHACDVAYWVLAAGAGASLLPIMVLLAAQLRGEQQPAAA